MKKMLLQDVSRESTWKCKSAILRTTLRLRRVHWNSVLIKDFKGIKNMQKEILDELNIF